MPQYNFSKNNNNNNTQTLIIIGISMLVLTFWNIFTGPSEEQLKQMESKKQQTQISKEENDFESLNEDLIKENKQSVQKRAKKEVFLENNSLKIAVDVNNNQITYAELKKYKDHVRTDKNVVLLDEKHFVETGWIGVDGNKINWSLKEKNKNSIVLSGVASGYNFAVKYILDEKYGLKIDSEVKNLSGKKVKIASYTRISSYNTENRIENSYTFRGILATIGGNVNEVKYDKVKKQVQEFNSNKDGWIAFSDQYWLTALIYNDNVERTYAGRYNDQTDTYQVDVRSDANEISNGAKLNNNLLLFVGPKKIELLNEYEAKHNIQKFDKAIDFGMFYFIAKSLLTILKRLYTITGNFGIAIILLTILVRLIIFPLANRSYQASAKMQLVGPELIKLREQYKEDKKGLQIATFELYKKHKINPMAAIWPLFLQIPIFFALYKVLSIAIEMRDAPFFGWIIDLSAKDPTSIFNLFGLLNFQVPSILQIGVLPIIMGFTMFIQMRMSPTQMPDKTQQKIIQWMPLMFVFMFAGMPSGLVLYWSCSNIFTIFQQGAILRIAKKKALK